MFVRLQQVYEYQIKAKSPWVLAIVLCVLIVLAFQARNFRLDASAESLLLENDQSLEYFREISQRYGSQEFLIITFTPKAPLFQSESLAILSQFRDELRNIAQVDSVVSVLDVPLLSNPPVPMTQLVANIKTLEDPNVDLAMAQTELANSPLYVNLLLNLSENTTALQLKLPRDKAKSDLIAMRNELKYSTDPNVEKQRSLIDKLIVEHNEHSAKQLHQLIDHVRDVITKYDAYGEVHLGGVPMIADDIIRFVRKDLVVFGLAALGLIVLTLVVLFRQVKWVVLPLVCSLSVVLTMVGMLGWLQWPVTVISSNFISLLLILTLSMNIHLVVRYQELFNLHSQWPQSQLVITTVRQIALPCFYMALTTCVAFISLLSSGIRPVINFGWMMSIGISIAFLMTFVVFPAMLMVIPKGSAYRQPGSRQTLTRYLAKITLRQGHLVISLAILLAAFTILGASRLIVENSFIDYFDEETEIYQGMSVIDQKLGGTTPLEVIIDFNQEQIRIEQPIEDLDNVNEDAFISEGGYENDFIDEDFLSMESEDLGSFSEDFVGAEDLDKYWFTADKIEKIRRLHQYLDGLPETGKVISLATMMEIAEQFNGGEPLTNIQLALLYTVIPEDFRAIVLDPYVSVEQNEARLNVRILDSMKGLKRDQLLRQIDSDMTVLLGFDQGQVRLTGMMVLYNNMLQSLFKSQYSTLGAVVLGILIMFLVLFRSLKLAIIALIPNLLSASLVLGLMGWLSIPLDIMTITIASITIGIAVDNTIHYIVRYQEEFNKDGSYPRALRRSHASIGRAIFYTSLTIIMGFSILALSNFKPTIYFGLLTALAMVAALLGALLLLPRLILIVKPFKYKQG